MRKKKKQQKRESVKYPALDPRYNSKIRQEYIDLDYVDKLDDTKKVHKLPDGTMVTELQWMAHFMGEWNSGGVGKQSEPRKNKLHRTKKTVKAIHDQTNSRNRDQYGIAKATNRIDKLDYEGLVRKKEFNNRSYVRYDHVEDALIDYLDSTKDLSKSTDDSDDKG